MAAKKANLAVFYKHDIDVGHDILAAFGINIGLAGEHGKLSKASD
jgi:hypothetical protein